MKKTYICILKDTETRLWGLSGRERLTRMLSKFEQAELIEDLPAAADTAVLFMRADYLFEPRLLQGLLQLQEDFALCASVGEEVVAVRTKAANAPVLRQELLGEAESRLISALPKKQAKDLVSAYDPKLLKYAPPEILPINRDNRQYLEDVLFSGAYKGITDFITLWLWPVPARWAVRACVKYKFSPNQVTLFSLVLAISTGLAFWYGYLLPGLFMGWLMTFLDTVDGKLARVTVSSSKLGDWLDHGLDLIHPPLWYLAWGMGIAEIWTFPFSTMLLFWIMLAAYIIGRLCEGGFQLWLAPFSLFLWQPWDSFNRLVTARRNPNLFFLTLSFLWGRPDIGLCLVVGWHVISSLLLIMRIYAASRQKMEQGELNSWLNGIDPERDRHRLEVRLFTRLSRSVSN